MEIWQHRKGGIYSVLGIHDGTVFYVAHADGALWFRPAAEFFDGRFTRLPDTAAPTPEALGFRRG